MLVLGMVVFLFLPTDFHTFGRQESAQRTILELLESGHDKQGVKIGALRTRVGVVDGEKLIHRRRPHLFVPIGNDLREIDERRVVGFGDFGGLAEPGCDL